MAKNESKSQNETVTIDIQPFMLPAAILLSAVILSISLLVGLNAIASSISKGGTGVVAGTGDTTATTTATYESLISQIGVDAGQFNSCFEAKEFSEEVKKDLADGQAAGISGTPGFIVGKRNGDKVEGYAISGALPSDVFIGILRGIRNNDQSAIDAAIGTDYKDYVTAGASASVDDDAVKGNLDSGYGIIEFSDLECPFCQRHHMTEYPKIISEVVDKGEGFYVFRDFPLSFHDPVASEAANAAQCVNKIAGSDAYFAFLDLYFANTKTNGEGL